MKRILGVAGHEEAVAIQVLGGGPRKSTLGISPGLGVVGVADE